jgi:hypothetical protein
MTFANRLRSDSRKSLDSVSEAWWPIRGLFHTLTGSDHSPLASVRYLLGTESDMVEVHQEILLSYEKWCRLKLVVPSPERVGACLEHRYGSL